MEEIWKEIKEQLRKELAQSSFSLWINPLVFLGQQNGTVILGCPNRFSMNWISENYLSLIKEKLYTQGLGDLEVELKVTAVRPQLPPSHSPVARQLAFPTMERAPSQGHLTLNRDYTFEKFVVGPSNEFAYTVSRAIAYGSCPDYNMLLMLANTGLGKTHLSHAVGQTILRQNPNWRVFYVTAEQFTNEMISSLKNNSIEQFKKKYRALCDVLLLEEIHFLSGKLKIQQELAHTLDALASDGKKIIFTSSLAPKDIPSLSKEFSSRVTAGLVTTIEAPDYETKVKIIEHKASEQNLHLSPRIVDLLAESLGDDVRHIESAIRCLKAKSELLNQKITLDLARDVLCHLTFHKKVIGLEQIRELVCKYYKIDPTLLESKSRKRIHVLPRNIYVYLARQHTEKSVDQIANSINRSHSTVLYAYEMITHRMKQDPELKRQVEYLSDKLQEETTTPLVRRKN